MTSEIARAIDGEPCEVCGETVDGDRGGIAYGRHAAAVGAAPDGAAVVCRSCGDSIVENDRSWRFGLPSVTCHLPRA